MTGLLQSNARLVAVSTGTAATGGRDYWDQPAGGEPAGAGAEKWTGDEPAYLREKVDRVTVDAGVTVVASRVLYVTSATARAAGIDTDDVLTFIGPDGTTSTARARTVVRHELDGAGVPPALQTTRLDLEDR